jgi:hypothetical protein
LGHVPGFPGGTLAVIRPRNCCFVIKNLQGRNRTCQLKEKNDEQRHATSIRISRDSRPRSWRTEVPVNFVETHWKTKNARPLLAGRPGSKSAVPLVEILVSVFLVGVVSASLFACFTDGFALMESSREDLRATQILLQKMETVRLCTWSQLTNITFTATYDPNGSTNNRAAGVIYTGTVTTNTASNIPNTCSYQSNICVVSVSITWTNYLLSHPVVHNRQMQTQMARYGMQNYLWGAQ